MANSRKKISELPALSVASLDTTFVLGISGSTTYKISINNLTSSLDGAFATDLVTNALSSSLNSKLSTSSFNSYTASFTASVASGTISGSSQLTSSFDQRYVVSGSITQTTWDNIANKPSGIVSQSTDLSSLNTFTASISTASLVNRLNTIESVSGSWITESETGSFLTSLSGAISSSAQVIGILSSLNSVSASLISKTGSYATTGSNTFYGDQIMVGNPSTQRVELSVGETYGGGKVFKILSGSYALIVDMNDLGSSQGQYMQVATNATSTTGSVNQSLILARSGSTPNDYNYLLPGNAAHQLGGQYYGLDMEDPAVMAYSSSIGGYNDWYIPSTTEIAWINQGVPGRLYEGFSVGNYYWTSNYAGSPYTYYTSDGQGRTNRVNASSNGADQSPVVAIRKINQSYREVITTDNTNISITGSLSVSGSITGSTNFNTIVNKPTLISGSAQITTFGFVSGSYETTGRGIISSSANLVTTSSFNSYTASISTASLVTSISNLNSATSSYLTSLSGAISSSSQLTSSFDTRYVASGSISAVPSGTISGSAQITAFGFVSSSTSVPAGTISGSSQLTSSFDGRYTQTGSFNTLTASFNSFTASAQSVTTGSNSFNGTQTITGSLIITTGSFFASQILANTASLYLTSGSNMYVQNNGLVEITGSLRATSITGSIAATNGVISGSLQLITSFPLKTTGTWSVPNGASTQSFSVESGASYTMWVNGNIPNGIITWNATVTTSNTNVPVAGSQSGWYYSVGNALVLTSMPDQIIGTSNTIISSPTSYAPNTSNVFKFGITNNSGTTQTINYGYIQLS